jgi:exonuclease III
MKFALFNSRSICYKTVGVLQLLSDFDVDISCITETWLRKADPTKFAVMKELGYAIHNKPRAGRGRGVAILFNNCWKLTPQKCKYYKTFESIESSL